MNKLIHQRSETVLITGTTSGIGYEFAHIFAEKGHQLVLVSRSTEKLEAQAEELRHEHAAQVHLITADLSDPKAPEMIFSDLTQNNIQVDILINNAGFNEAGAFSETDIEKELQMITTHVAATTHLTKLLLPGMIYQDYGRILNIGSTGSLAPCPLDAVYCATKAYVLSFSEALAAEFHGTGITVTALLPGATQTEFARKAGIDNTVLFNSGVMTARTVAEIGYRGLMKGKRSVVAGFHNKLMMGSRHFVPTRILDYFGRLIWRTVSHSRDKNNGLENKGMAT